MRSRFPWKTQNKYLSFCCATNRQALFGRFASLVTDSYLPEKRPSHATKDLLSPYAALNSRPIGGCSLILHSTKLLSTGRHHPVPPVRVSPGLLTSGLPASAAAFSISELISPPMKIAAPVKYSHSSSAITGFISA